MHRGVQPVGFDPEFLREEGPGEVDGVPLEVVAEREVAQHLEEGVVPCGPAHLLQIVVLPSGPNALLGGHGSDVVPLLRAEEDLLELDHTSVGEQERWILFGNQGRASDHLVASLRKEVQKPLPDLVCFHANRLEFSAKRKGSPPQG